MTPNSGSGGEQEETGGADDVDQDIITFEHSGLVASYKAMIHENGEALAESTNPEVLRILKRSERRIEEIHIEMEDCKSAELGQLQGRLKENRDILKQYTQPHGVDELAEAKKRLGDYEEENRMFLPKRKRIVYDPPAKKGFKVTAKKKGSSVARKAPKPVDKPTSSSQGEPEK